MVITVKEARKIMGKDADKYTDEEMEEVIRNLQVLADITIDSILEKRKMQKQKANEAKLGSAK